MSLPARSWVEIDTDAITHNIRTIRDSIGDIILAPCVKANAYGHDIVLVAQTCITAGADWLCVDAVHEARTLRNAGIDTPIYIMGYIPVQDFAEVVTLGCKLMVHNEEHLSLLNNHAKEQGVIIDVHIKIETGNNRQGIRPEQALSFARALKEMPHLRIEGLSTHFANIEDVAAHDFAQVQRKRLDAVHATLAKEGIDIPVRHCANSAATLMYPETHYEMVRPGVIVYGIWPSPLFREVYTGHVDTPVELRTCAAWKSCVGHIKKVPQGETIGYGRTYTTDQDQVIAIIPIGYYDGYDRNLSNKGYVIIRGTSCPVVGRVCMNMIMVDITHIHEIVQLEDEVLLMGTCKKTGETVDMEAMANHIDRITYELPTRILSGVHGDIPRIRV